MRGQKGERGDVGSPGLVGPPGPPGPQSLASPDEKGPAGVHYFLGASTGPRGERGESGPRGAPVSSIKFKFKYRISLFLETITNSSFRALRVRMAFQGEV